MLQINNNIIQNNPLSHHTLHTHSVRYVAKIGCITAGHLEMKQTVEANKIIMMCCKECCK